jgi:hypothetical protein
MKLLIRVLVLGVSLGVVVLPTLGQVRFDVGEALAASINPSLGQPSGLQLQGLDSTIRANWTPSNDPNMAWQVVSFWDGGTLVGSKVVSKSAVAVDANGLQSNHTYTLKVQSMDGSGALSNPLQLNGSTDEQSPIRNAAFFENFDDSPHGDLDSNYFDVRTSEKNAPSGASLDKRLVFNDQRHFHTQMIGGENHAGVIIRPRVPFDFTNRTGTFQFEVDMPPTQNITGKWFEINLTKDIAARQGEFGAFEADSGQFPNSIEFAIHHRDAPIGSPATDANGYNLPMISVNINGTRQQFFGTLGEYSPTNVRVPVVLHISQTSAEMLINGQSVVKASGFILPFTRGNWTIAHRSSYSNRLFDGGYAPPMLLQLIHWETIQFDGPDGSFNPVVRTYIQPGCDGLVNYDAFDTSILGCPTFSGANQAITLNIADNVSQARSARLLFNSPASNGGGTVTVNGTQLRLSPPALPSEQTVSYLSVPVSALRQGTNQVVFNTNASLAQVELEVVYSQARVIGNPPVTPMPEIALTTNNFMVQHLTTDPPIHTIRTFVYSQGSADALPYTAAVLAGSNWLTIASGGAGTVQSIPAGGAIIPIVMNVDATKIPVTTNTDADGQQVGIIKVTGGYMPAYIGVLAVNYGRSTNVNIFPASSFPAGNVMFNKAAIPDYHGASGSQTGPSATPTITSTPTPKPTPGATSTASPTLIRTATPTASAQSAQLLVGDSRIESTSDSDDPGTAEAFQYVARNSGSGGHINVYVDTTNTADRLIVGLYSHNSATNGPGTLLAQGILNGPTAGTWNSVAINGTSITTGTTYWIAVLGPAGGPRIAFRDSGGGGTSYTSRSATLTAFPSTWSSGASWASSPASAYVGP